MVFTLVFVRFVRVPLILHDSLNFHAHTFVLYRASCAAHLGLRCFHAAARASRFFVRASQHVCARADAVERGSASSVDVRV